MRKASITLCVLAALIVAVIVVWKIAYPTNTFRYKVTVNVETPEGLKSGSAVREVTIMQQPEVTPESRPHVSVKGEAVVVDLGKRGVLFATIGTNDEYIVFQTFRKEGAITREGARYYENLKAQAEVAPINYPLLVAFKDINDPKTVTVAYKPIIVDDERPGMRFVVSGVEDNMAELFGQNVRLKNIVLEMTDDPVTQGSIDLYISKKFQEKFGNWMRSMNISERGSFVKLFQFKQGEKV